MTKLTIGDSDSAPKHSTARELALAKAAQTYQITDEYGRTITLKRPPVLQQFRMMEWLGESASNNAYVSMVLPLLFIYEIDGVHAGFHSKLSLEALIQRLDQHGVNAVMEGVQKHFGQTDPEADREALKK